MELLPLTKSQDKIFTEVQDTHNNMLIIGPPGVGKSMLINSIAYHGYKWNKFYNLAGPTGLAALNIGGKTLHSIFRLPISQGVVASDFNNFPADSRVINNIRYNIKHLIIDEISMVRADMFDYIDRFMRYAKEVDKPFGGVQMILIGDFFQLPPVVERFEVPQLRDAGYSSAFVFSSKSFQDQFKVRQLTEVLRQKGDPTFIKFLHSARVGEVDTKQIKYINKKVGHPGDIRINLTCTNNQADEINLSNLADIKAEKYMFQGSKYGEWPALPVPQELYLKVGAQVMVKMNGADKPNDYEGKFVSRVVNGTLGIVQEIHDSDDGADVDKIVIEKEDGELVNIYRKRWERKIKDNTSGSWEERVVASYEQIPLVLAWAISIHKSQGQSFDKAHIDASNVFAPGQLYVAMSRVRSYKGLSLEGPVTTSDIWCNRDVVDFFESIEA